MTKVGFCFGACVHDPYRMKLGLVSGRETQFQILGVFTLGSERWRDGSG